MTEPTWDTFKGHGRPETVRFFGIYRDSDTSGEGRICKIEIVNRMVRITDAATGETVVSAMGPAGKLWAAPVEPEAAPVKSEVTPAPAGEYDPVVFPTRAPRDPAIACAGHYERGLTNCGCAKSAPAGDRSPSSEVRQMLDIARDHGGQVHGDDVQGAYDITFPGIILAVDFAREIVRRLPGPDVPQVDIRPGDQVGSFLDSVTVTVWRSERHRKAWTTVRAREAQEAQNVVQAPAQPAPVPFPVGSLVESVAGVGPRSGRIFEVVEAWALDDMVKVTPIVAEGAARYGEEWWRGTAYLRAVTLPAERGMVLRDGHFAHPVTGIEVWPVMLADSTEGWTVAQPGRQGWIRHGRYVSLPAALNMVQVLTPEAVRSIEAARTEAKAEDVARSFRCQDCGDPDGAMMIDPYVQGTEGREIETVLCARCAQEAADAV